MMKKLLFTIMCIALWVPIVSAKDIYIAQNAAGAASGADCADALAWSAFGSSSNWAPGNTLHICGTHSVALNNTAIRALASGSNGNPITIKFEGSTAILTSPAWPVSGGAIDCAGQSFITIDGGGNGLSTNTVGAGTGGGLITATANGDALANHIASTGIGDSTGGGCPNLTVQNVTLNNLYIRVQGSNNSFDDGLAIGAVNGNNNLITHNTESNISTGIAIAGCSNNGTISYNLVSFNNHSITLGPGGGNCGTAPNNINVIGNHLAGGSYVYDQSGNSDYHRDSLIVNCGSPIPACITGLTVANNYFYGVNTKLPTSPTTAAIFLDDYSDNTITGSVYNNIIAFQAPDTGVATGYIVGGNTVQFLNNTIVPAGGGSTCFQIGGQGASNGTLTYENNVLSGCGLGTITLGNDPWLLSGNVLTIAAWDYNIWYNMTTQGGGAFMFPGSGSCCNSFASLQSSGFDAHGQNGNNPNFVNAANCQAGIINGCAPASGSPLIGSGKNLAGLGIALLNTDMAGNPRPNSGMWTAGALNAGGGTTGTNIGPPTNLTASVN
jgi:hypothetical protein